jgi:hypothetical protein
MNDYTQRPQHIQHPNEWSQAPCLMTSLPADRAKAILAVVPHRGDLIGAPTRVAQVRAEAMAEARAEAIAEPRGEAIAGPRAEARVATIGAMIGGMIGEVSRGPIEAPIGDRGAGRIVRASGGARC